MKLIGGEEGDLEDNFGSIICSLIFHLQKVGGDGDDLCTVLGVVFFFTDVVKVNLHISF